MIEFVRQRHIAAPPERIWPYVDDVTQWPSWFTQAERAEVLSGAGLGRLQRMYGTSRSGKPTEIDMRITTNTPPARLGWHHEAERVDGKAGNVIFSAETDVEVSIDADAGGSLVTYRLRAEPGGLRNTFILRVLAARPIGQAFEASLARLAALTEAAA